MKPACIFCGNPPTAKNKEHIFPQWLLKMTGFDKKQASVGTDWSTGQEIVFSAMSYTFPACTKCNSTFATIEAKVKLIVEKLQTDQDVSGSELELLLDWFDKIRVGAWFGVKYMNKDVFLMTPKFYINSRVGLKDRVLFITNTYRPEKTLNWSGVNSPAFMLSPTAFSLRINNLVFVNCSSDFVISRQLGFPHVQCEQPDQLSEKTNMKMAVGTKIAIPQLFSTNLYSPSVAIAQAIHKNVQSQLPEYFKNEYTSEHSYGDVGKLFVSRNNRIAPIERNQMVNFAMPEAKTVYGHVEIVRPILELQIELILAKQRDLSLLSPQQRSMEGAAQRKVIAYLREQIRQYSY